MTQELWRLADLLQQLWSGAFDDEATRCGTLLQKGALRADW